MGGSSFGICHGVELLLEHVGLPSWDTMQSLTKRRALLVPFEIVALSLMIGYWTDAVSEPDSAMVGGGC